MQYAVEDMNGAVLVIGVAPSSVVLDGKEYPVGLFERLDNGDYKIVYYDAEQEKPVTGTFAPNDGTLRYHDPATELTKMKIEHKQIVPITDPSILSDRTFRKAWTLVDKVIGVDMAKARDVHRDHIREARVPKLLEADVVYYKAVEAHLSGSSIESQAAVDDAVSRKQKLRDMPQMPEIEAAQTPEELKAIWPEELGPNPWLNQPV